MTHRIRKSRALYSVAASIASTIIFVRYGVFYFLPSVIFAIILCYLLRHIKVKKETSESLDYVLVSNMCFAVGFLMAVGTNYYLLFGADNIVFLPKLPTMNLANSGFFIKVWSIFDGRSGFSWMDKSATLVLLEAFCLSTILILSFGIIVIGVSARHIRCESVNTHVVQSFRESTRYDITYTMLGRPPEYKPHKKPNILFFAKYILLSLLTAFVFSLVFFTIVHSYGSIFSFSGAILIIAISLFQSNFITLSINAIMALVRVVFIGSYCEQEFLRNPKSEGR
jgi:hypothetical protein